MRRHYPRGFKEEMIQKFESLSPKMRYIDFAKQNDIKLETLKTWIYDSRKKKKARAGRIADLNAIFPFLKSIHPNHFRQYLRRGWWIDRYCPQSHHPSTMITDPPHHTKASPQ